jgi:hypothetical protein
MAQVALFIGVKDGIRSIIDQGDPREMRIKFKTSQDGLGYDQLEVFESTVGRSRRRSFVGKSAPVVTMDNTPDPQPEIEIDSDTSEAIADLIEIAKGDARKKETKDARERLDALGIEY